jgi:cation/acetate symporter
MLVGIGFTAFYIIAGVFNKMAPWTFGVFPTAIGPRGIGTVGMFLNFAVTLGLTPFIPPASKATRDTIDSVREPEGAGPAVDIEAAINH